MLAKLNQTLFNRYLGISNVGKFKARMCVWWSGVAVLCYPLIVYRFQGALAENSMNFLVASAVVFALYLALDAWITHNRLRMSAKDLVDQQEGLDPKLAQALLKERAAEYVGPFLAFVLLGLMFWFSTMGVRWLAGWTNAATLEYSLLARRVLLVALLGDVSIRSIKAIWRAVGIGSQASRFGTLPASEQARFQALAKAHNAICTKAFRSAAVEDYEQRRLRAEDQAKELDKSTVAVNVAANRRRL